MRIDLIGSCDRQLAQLLEEEQARQRNTLDMIASESVQDPVSLALSGSAFAQKTVVGLPGHQRLPGADVIDRLEVLAAQRACALFGAEHANILPYSGTVANLCVYDALLQPGDTVLALDPEQGSHASHGRSSHISSRMYRFVHFGVDEQTMCIDYDWLEAQAKQCRPKLLVIGSSAYPRLFDFPRLAQIAHEVGAWLMVDMAHTTGLTAAGVIPSPLPHADVVTASCTKTMCGCHTGFILCSSQLAKHNDRGVYPGVTASMHPQTIAAAAWAFTRAQTDTFRRLMADVLQNAAVLAQALQAGGVELLTGGTDCHLLLPDLRNTGTDGEQVTAILGQMGIWVNTKGIPYDASTAPRGIRAGCTVLTQRGMGASQMRQIAQLFCQAVAFGENGYSREQMQLCRQQVLDLCHRFPLPC